MAAIIEALRSIRAGVQPQRTSLHTASKTGLKVRAPAPKLWGTLILVGFATLSLGAWWVSTSDSSDAELRAELAATREELRTAREVLRLRARAIEMAENEVKVLRKELANVRAAANAPGVPVFAADGAWPEKRTR